MNEKTRRWKCPICSQPSHYNSLLIDSYFLKILKEIANTTSEIEIFDNAEYKIIYEKINEENDSKKVEEIIDICDD